MGFYFYNGNRLERLATELAELTGRDNPDVFSRNIVAVHSRGMARWLQLQLAAHHGISADIEAPFLRAFVYRYIFAPLRQQATGAATGAAPDADLELTFSPAVMTWQLMAALPAVEGQPGFEAVARYVRGECRELKRYQISRRIAALFDQYLTYRPEMILRWESGTEDGGADTWQRHLWRILAAGREGQHFAGWQQAFCQAVAAGAVTLPELQALGRVFVFGFSTMPPAYLRLLHALSRLIDVHMFYLNPCQEHWQFNLSESEALRELAKVGDSLPAGMTPDAYAAAYQDVGNPLLGSWARQGREFFGLLCSLDDGPGNAPGFFAEAPPAPSLLRRIQADVQAMSVPPAPQPLSATDHSMQVHVCHSALREVEVLHDNLLRLFAADATLRPHQILVMAPDIEVYAPFVEAVFGVRGDADLPRIFATVADRGLLASNPESAAYVALLRFLLSRFLAADVIELLQVEAIRRRFNLDEEAVDTLTGWLREAGAAWGIDGAFRERAMGVNFSENSWRFALDRMLLGYVMSPVEAPAAGLYRPPAGDAILPFDGLERSGAVWLGQLADMLERLFAAHRRLTAAVADDACTSAWWLAFLTDLLDDFFAVDKDSAQGLQEVRTAVVGLARHLALAQCETVALAPEVVVAELEKILAEHCPGGSFLKGGVTFCRLLPMRSIPARVICLIGMNDGVFPRREQAVSFDLMAQRPRWCDRSARDEDRALFLEAVLSARETLYLSYVGQSVKTNAPIPPSVLVSELLDYVDTTCAPASSGRPSEALVTRHPLQPFSSRYFSRRDGDDGLFSYARNWCAAARRIHARDQEPPRDAPPFFPGELPPPAGVSAHVTVAELTQFFRSPCAALLRHRLNLRLDPEDAELPEEQEVFDLSGLTRYTLREQLLVGLATPGLARADLYAAAAAGGRLPASTWGEVAFAAEHEQVAAFAAGLRAGRREQLPAVTVDIPLPESGATLTARFDGLCLWGDGNEPRVVQLTARYAALKATDLLRVWFLHLAANTAAARARLPIDGCDTLVFGSDGGQCFSADSLDAAAAAAQLEAFIALYRRGQCAPLAFWPAASCAWAKAMRKSGPQAAWRPAADKWEPSDYHFEAADAYTVHCFGAVFPRDEAVRAAFADLAGKVFGPLLDACTKITLPAAASGEASR